MSAETSSSVDQAFDVLALLSEQDDSIGVAQLARRLGLPTSTAHRVLATLEDAGYVARDTTGAKYQLGLGAQELTHALLRRFPVRAASQPLLGRLAVETGETTVLGARVGFYYVRVASAEGTRDIHAAPRLGQTSLLEQTTGGRVILAFLDPDLRRRYLSWRAGRGLRSGAARALRSELDEIRRQGYALKRFDSRCELALPVCDERGRVVASVAVEAAAAEAGARADRARLARARAAVREIDGLLREQPALARDPFGHIAPEELNPGFDPTIQA